MLNFVEPFSGNHQDYKLEKIFNLSTSFSGALWGAGKIFIMGNFNRYKIKFSHKEVIEPEEILLDSKKLKEEEHSDYELGRMELSIKKRNFIIFFTLVMAGFLALFLKTGLIQIRDRNFYLAQAEENAVRIYPISSQRGVIYDRNFKQLVSNQPSFNLVLDKYLFDSKRSLTSEEIGRREKILNEISEILKIPQEEIFKILKEEAGPKVIIAENLEHETILALEVRLKDIKGAEIEKDFRRKYLDGPYFSKILGFLRRVSPDDLNYLVGYFPNDFIGKSGLEQSYESVLRGAPGKRRVEKDVKNIIKKEEILSLPQDGQSLVLHLDYDLQKTLYGELSKMAGGRPAAAVALDPRSGGILAMVSLPSFDNNIFSQKVGKEEFEKLDLLNRSISGLYPTGSIIKPISAVAALSEKIISPGKTINCLGGIQVGNRVFQDWKAHGPVDMIKAIAQSCNVYFYTVGGGYGKQEGLGLERILKYLKLFGWGQKTGIDIQGEKEGILPEKLENPSNIYSISIGQGDIAITPLQVAASYGALANGGILFKPHLVNKVVDTSTGSVSTLSEVERVDKEKNVIETIEPEIIRQNFILNEYLEISKKGMREAVVSGSSQSLNSLPVKVAGKTGTAQFGKGGLKTHAWFSGFAPYDNPEIVLTIIIEGGGEGSATAVPVAKNVLEWYFNKNKEK